MSRSPYVDNVVLTNKHSGRRTHKVQAFVIHHMAARWTGKRCAEYFRDTPSSQASANYCIGYDGDVALNVEEGNRAWTSSSNWADQRALTYELANSKTGHPWEVSDKTINKLIVMLAEQHKRYGLKKASYTGDTKGTLWRHDWFANTNCPGPYLGGKLSYIADEVNKILRGEDEVIEPKKKPVTVSTSKKSIQQMAQEVIDGKHGNGHETRRKSLGITQAEYEQVRAEVNSHAGVTVPKQSKSIAQMAQEVIDGKHGNGHDKRRRSLGIDQSTYNKVRDEVNRRAGVSSGSGKSIKQMADEVIAGKHGNGNAQRQKSLGIDNATYQKVRAEVNKRL